MGSAGATGQKRLRTTGLVSRDEYVTSKLSMSGALKCPDSDTNVRTCYVNSSAAFDCADYIR